jgi:hypothetical protein
MNPSDSWLAKLDYIKLIFLSVSDLIIVAFLLSAFIFEVALYFIDLVDSFRIGQDFTLKYPVQSCPYLLTK